MGLGYPLRRPRSLCIPPIHGSFPGKNGAVVCGGCGGVYLLHCCIWDFREHVYWGGCRGEQGRAEDEKWGLGAADECGALVYFGRFGRGIVLEGEEGKDDAYWTGTAARLGVPIYPFFLLPGRGSRGKEGMRRLDLV